MHCCQKMQRRIPVKSTACILYIPVISWHRQKLSQFDSIRMTMGIHPENFVWKLEQGESFAVGARKVDKTLIKKINQGLKLFIKMENSKRFLTSGLVKMSQQTKLKGKE